MNANWSSRREQRLKERRRQRGLFVSLLLLMALSALVWKFFQPTAVPEQVDAGYTFISPGAADSDLLPVGEPEAKPEAKPEPEADHIFTKAIDSGDTLSSIFDQFGLEQSVMYQILAADESLLALDILRPGQRLTFTLDQQTRKLVEMELFIHPGNRVVYQRIDHNGFDYEEIVLAGDWGQELLEGEIDGSFYLSARSAGLTDQETGNIAELLADQLHFSRDMRAGDLFQVIRSRQFVEGEFTGQSRIEGVRIFRGKRLYTAFLFEDGNYYDQKGESLARAFRRYPTTGQHRVSSHFNPARRHPVTGRVSPHNGVDFAMSTGTPVVATGDGIVTRVKNHPYAGKYIEIQHGSHYATRYLHLNRILVRPGKAVKRGERIALSGNTGRSTGPHLHFELHVKGRPTNPLTAKIPMASAVPNEKIALFKQHVEDLVAIMDQPSLQIALYRKDDQF